MKTNVETVEWSKRYQKALRRYLVQDATPRLQPALKLGCQAATLGMETLKLAQIHAQAFRAILLPDSSATTRKNLIAQAKKFFDETNSSIEKTHVSALKQEGRVRQLAQELVRRTAESKASLLRLKREILQRKKAEAALLKSGTDHAKLVQISDRLSLLLRNQTYAILGNQEKTRKKISQGLQNTIAQTLLGINIELLALKTSNKVGTEHFSTEIDAMNREAGLDPKGATPDGRG